MTDAHAKFAPSSMYLTVACPGWHSQGPGLPETETEESREGDAGHWVALFARTVNVEEAYALVGAPAPNMVEIDEDMVDGSRLWVEALEGYPARLEERLQIKSLHATDCWGTPDGRQWNPDTKTHRSADYKYGHGFVDEFENWQNLSYTVGSLDQVYPTWRTDAAVTAEMTIVQPRYYRGNPIRTWTIQTAGLLHYEARMQAAIREAEGPNPRVISGPHCKHCPKRVNCGTYHKAVMGIVDYVGVPDTAVRTPDEVGRELKLVQTMIKRLEARETGLVAVAESMIKAGTRVPNFKMEAAPGRLTWSEGVLETVEMMANLAGKTIYNKPKPVTPTQAAERKLIDRHVRDLYATRPNGAMKLVPDDPSKLARKLT